MNNKLSEASIIKNTDVYWEYHSRSEPNSEPEVMFEKEKSLARLLAEDVIILNDHWWEVTWSEEAKKITCLGVDCSDVFAWGCADAEEVLYSEIKDLYDMWHADNRWGPAKWCAIKRNKLPQQPVIDSMKKNGAWCDKMEFIAKSKEQT